LGEIFLLNGHAELVEVQPKKSSTSPNGQNGQKKGTVYPFYFNKSYSNNPF